MKARAVYEQFFTPEHEGEVMSDSNKDFHSKKMSERNLKRNHPKISERGAVG